MVHRLYFGDGQNTYIGSSVQGGIVLDGGGSVQLLFVYGDYCRLVLEDITLTNALTDEYNDVIYGGCGGAIYVGGSHCELILNSCTLSSNTASSYYMTYGGAIYSEGSHNTLEVTASTFKCNVATVRYIMYIIWGCVQFKLSARLFPTEYHRLERGYISPALIPKWF